MLLAPVVSQKIPQNRMPRPRPKSAALALVVTNFISQLRIRPSRQRIRRNKLSLARRKALSRTLPIHRPTA